MKIKVNMNVTLEVSEEEGKRILSDSVQNSKPALLMTMYCGNSDSRPELGKWYLEGDYIINDKIKGTI